MKRLICCALALLMLLALAAGCSEKPVEPSGESTAPTVSEPTDATQPSESQPTEPSVSEPEPSMPEISDDPGGFGQIF